MPPVSSPFSARLPWDLLENRLASAEAQARNDPRFIDLTVSNPTVVGLPDAGADLARALADTRPAAYAPAARGAGAARRAIAEAYGARGVSIEPERVLLTASSSESYSFLFKLLCDPGDAVLIPSPSYPLFDFLVRLEGATPVPYRLSRGPDLRWHIDLEALDEALAQLDARGTRARAVVVVSPNNPTGSVLDEADAAALDARCAPRGMVVVCDEVFADFIRRPSSSHVSCLAARETATLTFSLGGLSKSCGLPQLKLGWIAAGGPPAGAEAALARLELIADTYLSVNAVTEGALPALLRVGATFRRHLRERLRANEAELTRALGPGSPLSALPREGGWSAIVRVPALLTDENWALALLEREGVLVQPGFFFDLDQGTFLVVSLLPPERDFARGIARLVAHVEAVTAGNGEDDRDASAAVGRGSPRRGHG
jgi:alanine-synthesizing transaminase